MNVEQVHGDSGCLEAARDDARFDGIEESIERYERIGSHDGLRDAVATPVVPYVAMKLASTLLLAVTAAALPAAAHHSIAIYDIDQSVHFDGVVAKVQLSNPHINMTLTVTKGDGTTGTVDFIEGVPAGMLARMGLDPAEIAVGRAIKAIGAPLRDDPNAYFLKAIILADGRRFTFVD
jgi:hypothetical protein